LGRLATGLLTVAEGFEPSHGRINSAMPYRLATPHQSGYRQRGGKAQSRGLRLRLCAFVFRQLSGEEYSISGSRSRTCRPTAYETVEPPLLYSRVKSGGDEGSRTLIVRFTRPTLCFVQLSYIAPERFGGPGGIQTLTGSLQDFHAVGYITGPESLRVPVAVGGVEPPTSRL
jgi:hypothetical protein